MDVARTANVILKEAMSNIFTRLKGQLQRDFGGRYLGVMLEQVILSEPRFAKIIFPNLPIDVCKQISGSGPIRVNAEHSFLGKGGKRRRADLAITKEDNIVALAEIKYEDELAKGNHSQTQDYLWIAAQSKSVHFTYLTQFPPDIKCENLIRNAGKENQSVRHLYYRDLYREAKESKNSAVVWLCEFLEEQHVVYKESLGEDALGALKLLLAKGLYVKHAHGLGRLVSQSSVAQAATLLGDLIGNVNALSDWFYSSHRKHFGNRFSVDFCFDPSFKTNAVKRSMEKLGTEKSTFLRPDSRDGGELCVYAQGKLRGKKGYVCFGYVFDLNLEMKSVDGGMWAGIYFDGLTYECKPISFRLSSSLGLKEKAAQAKVTRTTRNAIELALKDGKATAQLKKQLLALLHAGTPKV